MSKTILKFFLIVIITIKGSTIHGQSNTPQLIAENQQSFINSLIGQKNTTPISIKVSKGQSLSLVVNIKEQTDNDLTLIGIVNNKKSSTFSFSKVKGKLAGTIILQNEKTAYKLFTKTNNKVFIEEIDINKILCIDFEKAPVKKENNSVSSSKMAPQLESLPGATGTIYLDFDGEVVSGTDWAGGSTINAKPPGFSDDEILKIWKIMAEDFRPFNLNITTRRGIFEAAPKNRRMMCIFTPTDDAAPGSGGVAFIRSFSSRSDEPCWIYNIGTSRVAGETGSHEVGHTLGLLHDSKGNTVYYSGHGKWSPIMGWSASREIGQWSQGEFENANQTEDDIAIIGDNRNGVGFRNDDHNDIIGNNATTIKVSDDGKVNPDKNFGLINSRDDKDVFSFVTETGDVSFSFNPDPDYPNLNIQAKIINALGEEVVVSDPSGLSASITTNLNAGTYFIEIDGVGEGTPFNGYSDYASLGNYFISGNYSPGNNLQPPVANFEAIKNDCSTVNFKSTTINKVTAYRWDFGDDTSSTEQNPIHIYETGGNFTVSLTAINEVGENTNNKSDLITINLPNQPVGDDQNICPGESATITISGNSEYQWYNQPTGGTSIATGTTYKTPTLEATKTYYVSGIIGDCITKTRTAIKAVVLDIPNQPSITVNQDQKLAIDTEFTTYQWFLEGEAIADGTGATYLPQETGEYSIEVGNAAGCKTISSEFAIDQSQLNLSLNSKTFIYYPNPVKEDKLLNIEGITIYDYDLRIVDILGQTILQSAPTPEVNVSELSKGMYIILINNKSIGKFIKE